MTRLRCVLPRWLLGGALCLGLLTLAAHTGRTDEKAAETKLKATSATGALTDDWIKPLTWRCIGPANMGGRITALAVYEKDPTTYYVATASGGLLKTTNNGVTFEHQFDREATVSIGDVCVAPSDPNIVWVGTGENNPRNSVSYGDGVYKSEDGGRSWTNMGLKKSFQIGKLVIHPTNPDIVYVGALGRLYGPNEERGLFKTTDGGKTWQKILYVDDKTGIIDVKMSPANPDTLLVATFERQRDGYDFNDPVKKWGPGSGLHKTTDGGKTFKKITQGLPSNTLGRMAIDYYLKEPNVVFLIVDCEKIGMGNPPRGATIAYLGIQGEDGEKGAKLTQITPQSPADQAGLKVDDIVIAIGTKKVGSYEDLTQGISDQKPGDKVKVQVRRGAEVKEIEVTIGTRAAAQGGKPGGGGGGQGGQGGGNRPNTAFLGGQAANVQDTQGPNSHEYGGIYKSTDGGDSWTRINSLNPRPMYFSHIRVDPSDDKYLYVMGVQQHQSRDGGKTFTADLGRGVHADGHAMWINPKDGRHMIIGCDGGTYVSYDRGRNWDHLNHLALGQFYHVAVDTRRDYKAYGGLQDNGSWGGPSMTRGFTGPVNEDWFNVGGGDGFRCLVDPHDPDLIYSTSQNGGMRRLHLKTRETASIRPGGQGGPGGGPGGGGGGGAGRGPRYRFNWNTPFILSNQNSKIFYCAGNVVFRSLDRGNNLQAISPEITATDRGSATALAESPGNPNVLYVGTDDGYLWVTKDGGKDWTNITKNVGLPGLRWVASIEASRYAEGRAYVVFDGHRSDDDDPLVYVTEDFGQTWMSLRNNLPWGSTRVLREDIENQDLLYLGTEFGAWASLDRGKAWTRINNNLPTVAVHEFAIHPTAGEIVAATHGRSLWILDVTALRQMKPETLTEKAQLYKPTTAVRWQTEPSRGRTNRRFTGTNPPPGAQLYYSLPAKAEKVSVKVTDIDGKTLRELRAPTTPGLHRVAWDLRAGGGGGGAGDQPGGRFGGGGRGGQKPGAAQKPGEEQKPPAGQPPQAGAGRRGGGGGGGGGFGQAGGRPVASGMYRIVLNVDGQEIAQSVRVIADPAAPDSPTTVNEEDEGDEVKKETVIDDN